jgi:hypothetical protein
VRKAMRFKDFRQQFNDRVAVLLSGVMEGVFKQCPTTSQQREAAHDAFAFGAYGFTPSAAAEEYVRQHQLAEKPV